MSENVMDSEKFHQNFIDGNGNFSDGALQLRQFLENNWQEGEWKHWKFQKNAKFGKGPVQPLPTEKISIDKVNEFLNKIVFLVNSPVQEKFDGILESVDVVKYYKTSESASQTTRIVNEVENWVLDPNRKIGDWLNQESARRILLSEVDEASDVYFQQLNQQSVGWNDQAVHHMAQRLGLSVSRVLRITSQFPNWTATKVISALAQANQKRWIVSGSLLDEQSDLWRNRVALLTNKYQVDYRYLFTVGYHYLVVVEEPVCDLKSILDASWRLRIIVMTTESKGSIDDEIQFEDLDQSTANQLLSKTVFFQESDTDPGTRTTVNDLIDKRAPQTVLDCSAMKELMDDTRTIRLPPIDMTRYDDQSYVTRMLSSSSREYVDRLLSRVAQERQITLDQLDQIVSIEANGAVRWRTTDQSVISDYWKTLISEDEEFNVQTKPTEDIKRTTLTENQFTEQIRNRFIITGVAGTGKSTLLSSLCQKIKRSNRQIAVLKHKLDNENFKNIENNQSIDRKIAQEFFLGWMIKSDAGHFLTNLLRHRVSTGDRIVLLLDGYDELTETNQNTLTTFINQLNKSVCIYITTRSHAAVRLQSQLSQLADTLLPFSRDDQSNLLVAKLNQRVEYARCNPSLTKSIADHLVDQTILFMEPSNESFVGIPLLIDIVCEYFLPKIIQVFDSNAQQETDAEWTFWGAGLFGNMASLYRLMMNAKRQIFQQERLGDSQVELEMDKISYAYFEDYLISLAIRKLANVENQDILCLLPPLPRESPRERRQREKLMDDMGIRYGIFHRNASSDRVEFMHKTYAEYLVANYVYNGLKLDDDEHNGLLESEEASDWIARVCLSLFQWRTDYIGVRYFLNSLLENDDLFGRWIETSGGVGVGNDDSSPQIYMTRFLIPKMVQEYAEIILPFVKHYTSLLKGSDEYASETVAEYIQNFLLLSKLFIVNFLTFTVQFVISSWIYFAPADEVVVFGWIWMHTDSDTLLTIHRLTFQRFMQLMQANQNSFNCLERLLFYFSAGFIDPSWSDSRLERFVANIEQVIQYSLEAVNKDDLLPCLLEKIVVTECRIEDEWQRRTESATPLKLFLSVFDKYSDSQDFRSVVLDYLKTYLRKSKNNSYSWLSQKLIDLKFDWPPPQAVLLLEEPDLYEKIFLQSDIIRTPESVDSPLAVINPSGLTSFHSLAFHNNVKLVRGQHRQLLNPSMDTQESVDRLKRYVQVMTEGHQTPLVIAVLRLNEELCEEMTTFMNRLVHMGLMSQQHLDNTCDRQGCLHQAYWELTRLTRKKGLFLTQLKLIEICANRLSSLQDLTLNFRTACFTHRIGKRHSDSSSIVEQHGEPDSSLEEPTDIIDTFHTLWRRTQFMRDASVEDYNQWIDSILAVDDQRRSQWSDYIDEACRRTPNDVIQNGIATFLAWVTKKLGHETAENLVLRRHPSEDKNMIESVLDKGNIYVFESLLSVFDADTRLQIRDDLMTTEYVDKIWDRAEEEFDDLIFHHLFRRIACWSDSINEVLARFYTLNLFLHKYREDGDLLEYLIRSCTSYRHLLGPLWVEEIFPRLISGRSVLGGVQRSVDEMQYFVDFLQEKEFRSTIAYTLKLDEEDGQNWIERIENCSLAVSVRRQLVDIIARIISVDK